MSNASFDFSELDRLAADLSAAPAKARDNVRKAVEVTARHVRDAWREPLKGSASVRGGDRTISYDVRSSRDEIRAEIGPEIGGVGALVGMLEYGTPTVGPTGYGHAALQKNEEDFIRGILKATEGVL